MQTKTLKYAALMVGSGMCALVYQTAWLRELRLVFGASTFASAAVLAIFMGGLGLGGIFLGRRADRSRNPLLMYANLELLVAGAAAVTPGLIWLASKLYFATGGTSVLGLAGASIVRIVIATLVLAVPTLAMGGTLPALARAVEHDGDLGRRALARIYGANALGAVAGALLSTFALFEIYGTRNTIWLAALVNALVALVARTFSRAQPGSAEGPDPVGPPELGAQVEAGLAPKGFVLAAAGVVGLAFFVMELVWYRMLGPLLGGSTYSFGLILAVALAGISLGSAAYGTWGRNRQPTLAAFAITCVAEAACIALPFALGDRLAIAAGLLRSLEGLGFAGLVLSWTLVTSVVVLPAAFVSGAQFPLLIGLLGRGRESVGTQVGQAYAVNTVGSIVGSLAGGFLLIPLLGAIGSWTLVVALLVALGASAVVIHLARQRNASEASQLFTAGLLGVGAVSMLFASGPSAVWRHSAIGAGRAALQGRTENELEAWARERKAYTTWESEGIESSVALNSENGLAFVVNGKSDGSAIGDAATQVMGGMLGAILHPRPRTALVVGLGTGSSAGWLGAIPEMERVDVVEIEPAILEVARFCDPVNERVLDNPRVRVMVADAREHLMTTRETYDVVFSEPSNPYRAGISSLFTAEFYDAVRGRLAPGGLFVQWLQAYEIDPEALATVAATLATAFRDVQFWQTEGHDLLLVASDDAAPLDVERLRGKLQGDGYRQSILRAWHTDSVEGLFSRFISRGALAERLRASAGNQLNTDDHNPIEFAFARSVGKRGDSLAPQLLEISNRLQLDRPLVTGEVDWERVDEERGLLFGAAGLRLPRFLARKPAVYARAALASHVNAGRLPSAKRAYEREPFEPAGLIERLLVARVLALSADPRVGELLDPVAPEFPSAAQAVRAAAALAGGRVEEANAALVSAFESYRADPWSPLWALTQSFEAAVSLARKEPARGSSLLSALEAPFVLRALDRARNEVRLELARVSDFPAHCRKLFAELEPHVPWRQDALAARFECYRAAGTDLLPLAEKDLQDFTVAATSTVDAELGFPLPPASGASPAAPVASSDDAE